MKVFYPQNVFSDERGYICDILTHEVTDSITTIFSRQGAVRGNHYHKDTWQWIYLISGELRYVTKYPDGEVVESHLTPGAVLLSEPLEIHAMEAISDCHFMVFTRGPRGGEDYEKDTFRVIPPLITEAPKE